MQWDSLVIQQPSYYTGSQAFLPILIITVNNTYIYISKLYHPVYRCLLDEPSYLCGMSAIFLCLEISMESVSRILGLGQYTCYIYLCHGKVLGRKSGPGMTVPSV